MTRAVLLLADPSPSLRVLTLADLLGRPDEDTEVRELRGLQESDPLIAELTALQNEDGSWRATETGGEALGKLRLTAQALMRLGYLGLPYDHPSVKRGVEYIFSHQMDDGRWPLGYESGVTDENGLSDIKYHMIPLQTALPLLGVARAGYATDARAEAAYEWLLDRQLPDGGWPAGMHREKYLFAAGYRRLARSRFGCRTNTTAAVSALAMHPERRRSDSARRGLDLLLAHEHRQAHTLGFEIARVVGFEKSRGSFSYYARYDVAQMLDLSWRIGASLEDMRVADNVKFVNDLQNPSGLWEYRPFPEVSNWMSFDLLRSLSRLDDSTDWLSIAPRMPFQPYPGKPRRF
jgi:hypothetical protein